MNIQGRIQGEGVGRAGQDPPPPRVRGPPNFIKREKTSCACTQRGRIFRTVTRTAPLPPLWNPVSAPNIWSSMYINWKKWHFLDLLLNLPSYSIEAIRRGLFKLLINTVFNIIKWISSYVKLCLCFHTKF